MSSIQPRRNHVVVVFGSEPADEWCKLSHCPMHAHGPYTREEAERIAEALPQWMQPHILVVNPDTDACLGPPD